MVGTLPARVPS